MRIKLALSVATLIFGGVALNASETTKLDSVQVVTSASGYEQKITDAPASISVITQEDLQKKSYTSLVDAVSDIEGIDLGAEVNSKTGQKKISMRGMGADYTLILIDGKKQNNNGDIYQNGQDGFDMASMPPLSMIERIEVIRGPMSTLYGSDAMGGVINIITKKISNEWTGSITHGQTIQQSNQFGDIATTDFAIMGPLIKDKLGISLRGSYYDKAPSNPKNSNGMTDIGKSEDNQNWTFGTGLTFTPNENNTIKANFDIAKQKYDNSEGSSGGIGTVHTAETLYTSDGRVGYKPIMRMQREQYSLDWEANWDLGKSTVGVHHIKTENNGRVMPLNSDEREQLKDLRTIYGSNAAGYENFLATGTAAEKEIFNKLSQRDDRTMASTNTTLSAKYELPLNNHFIVIGADYLEASLEDGIYNNMKGGEKEYYQYALFAEDNWNIVEPLNLTFGARYDKHEDFGDNVSPRAYVNYNITDNWTVKGGVATGYKTPKANDLQEGIVSFGGQGRSPTAGNPDLKPEKSVSYEAAVYYTHPNKHSANLTIFQNDFEDKIETVNIGGNQLPAEWVGIATSPNQKQNVGDATIKGIEASGKLFILDNLSVKVNYTFTDSEVKDHPTPARKGEPLVNSAKHIYSATIDWDITSKVNTFLRMYGEKDRYRGEDYAKYYEDYQIFDLGASYKANKNLTINTRISNLFDKDFTETILYDDNGTLVSTDKYRTSEQRRAFFVSMKYTF